MDPGICLFPNKQFYEGKLTTATAVLQRKPEPWLAKSGLGGSYRIFDVNGREARDGNSIYNNLEVDAVLALLKRLFAAGDGMESRVAVIAPYKAQVTRVRSQLASEFGDKTAARVEVGTVDAFQGQENDIIIFSCTRSGRQVGFLSDTRRCNVALTRARLGLYIVGR